MRCSLSRAIRVLTGRFERLGVSDHPGLLFRPSQEGYRDFAFGARAGPRVSATDLFHELAHAAELGGEAFERRATIHGFGFAVPEEWICDRFFSMPKTMQATARELRTFAYQFHLMREAGYRLCPEPFAAYAAGIMQFMHDWYCVPGGSGEARTMYCKELILKHIEELPARQALDRLVDCLDRTRQKLKILDASGPDGLRSDTKRYWGDGSVYQPS